jgi:hypothetical protein
MSKALILSPRTWRPCSGSKLGSMRRSPLTKRWVETVLSTNKYRRLVEHAKTLGFEVRLI